MERLLFWYSLLGIGLYFIPYYLSLAVLGVSLYFGRFDLKHSFFGIAGTSFGILNLVRACWEVFGWQSEWSLALSVYVSSLGLFHVGDFLCQSYFHPKHSDFDSKC
mmetsp:Transcript_9201/g.13685  ORF Transcript_9201/g.13685 Transcript_9201/m.13685 type:complete len:106 (+) Transcript_9201:62-379(+)